jgi:hypothetical protein
MKLDSYGWYGVLFNKRTMNNAEDAAKAISAEVEEEVTADKVRLEWLAGNSGVDDVTGKPWVTRGGKAWTVKVF